MAATSTVTAALIVTGCRPTVQPKPTAAISIVTDVTGSTAAVRPTYAAATRVVVGSAPAGAVVDISPITDNSQASGYRGFEAHLPAFDPLTANEDQFRDDRSRADAAIMGKFKGLARRTDGKRGSDLISAFDRTAAVLEGGRCCGVADKRLVVESDGVQQSPDVDFTRLNLTAEEDATIIRRLEAAGAMPDLRGVRVWFAGLGADSTGEISPGKILQIRQFWIAYFRAAGADLSPDRCGAILENYP